MTNNTNEEFNQIQKTQKMNQIRTRTESNMKMSEYSWVFEIPVISEILLLHNYTSELVVV